ncbi:ABC transporter permease [Actinokineospora cianjurensis]|uniref:Putative ABC transport system permease protein n=1 Tax=Actinokineospora cianjurensis TaxID=585224 RepID=A0A421B055_9PSEU|nr:ABC transporter permease [Actinokineospora cianjurensis]RLK55411.1 putative ABC transport system permease protein [Actinokineospora cianjurensis]
MALTGRFRSAVVIGGQGIRARKLRTFLSMISLFLGVLAIVAVQASSVLANRALLADIEMNEGKDGTVMVGVPPGAESVSAVLDLVTGHPGAVATTSTGAIIGEPGLTPVNPGGVPLRYADQGGPVMKMVCDGRGNCYSEVTDDKPPPRGNAVELQVVGVTGDIRQFRPFQLETGSWLDFGGEPSMSPRLVLNREAAEAFTRYRLPAEMTIGGSGSQPSPGSPHPTPRVVGAVHDGSSQPTAYVRADELLRWLPEASNASQSMGILMTQEASASITPVLRAKLGPELAGQIYTHTIDSRERIGGQLDMMKWIFYGMAALVLLIGVAGILNVGLATVGERVEEFALRRAVGTPRLLLAGIVLAETLIIGLLTAAAAIGVGVAGLEAAGQLFGANRPSLQNVAFPWEAGVAGVAAGIVAGVLGGLFPAIRAARIPIATVMRA